jgi:hypothetical protein
MILTDPYRYYFRLCSNIQLIYLYTVWRSMDSVMIM